MVTPEGFFVGAAAVVVLVLLILLFREIVSRGRLRELRLCAVEHDIWIMKADIKYNKACLEGLEKKGA